LKSTDNSNIKENSVFKLPILGEFKLKSSFDDNDILVIDTIYHTIAGFEFINQYGEKFSQKDTEGKIYIADFIFTSCPSICPIMTDNLKEIFEKYKENKDFLIVSHSIDPEFDTPKILTEYANKRNINNKNWIFLTGDRDEIYEIAEKSYLAYAKEDANAPGGYIHSGFVVLIDPDKRVRGAYDATEVVNIEKLERDIEILMKEYAK
jgi:protein SCO1/2